MKSAEEILALARKRYNATLLSFDYVNDELAVMRVQPDGGVPRYKAGQYTTLGLARAEARVEGTQEDTYDSDEAVKIVKRAYSIAHPVLNGSELYRVEEQNFHEFYIVLIREDENSPPLLTPRLFALKPGDRLFCGDKIVGNYTLDRFYKTAKHVGEENACVVFLATGTGEAPHNNMTWRLLTDGFKGRIVSIVCARYQRDLGYIETQNRLMEKYPNYKYISFTTREPGQRKRYIQDFIEEGELAALHDGFVDPERTHVYLCGNPAMIGIPKVADDQKTYPEPKGCVEILEKLGFESGRKHPHRNIHYEEYW
ncbi:MAG: ferredoxin--NADP reductase [Deltaproteobacteria bacterium]|nr:ferredoxin--NADP reductase [Deltaproteobacteria bacterium]